MSNVDKDVLGSRMKESYENRTRFYLPRRTYTILRLDGCHWHTYTKGLQKPFDNDLSEDIDNTIKDILPEIQGSVFAYTQSDEISILLTDFESNQTCAWFDGNLQKMTSVSSSIMTAHFNQRRPLGTIAYFDSRAFTIPDRTEVMNYFIWRQQDCIRNSVSMVAQANFSHKELHGKSQSDMHEMLHQKGVNWATDFTDGQKNGRLIVKENYISQIAERIPDTDVQSAQKDLDVFEGRPISFSTFYPVRSRWIVEGAWKFTKDKDKLLSMIPKYE